MCRPRRTGFTGRIAGELQVLFYPVTDDVSDNGSYGSSLLAHLSHVGRGHFLPPSFRNTGWRSPMRIKVPVVPASFFGMVIGLAGLGTARRWAHQVWGLLFAKTVTFPLLAHRSSAR